MRDEVKKHKHAGLDLIFLFLFFFYPFCVCAFPSLCPSCPPHFICHTCLLFVVQIMTSRVEKMAMNSIQKFQMKIRHLKMLKHLPIPFWGGGGGLQCVEPPVVGTFLKPGSCSHPGVNTANRQKHHFALAAPTPLAPLAHIT